MASSAINVSPAAVSSLVVSVLTMRYLSVNILKASKILWYKFVRHESVADYVEGVEWLRENGFVIYGIVCDGMRGLFQALRPYPVQMCQFHQLMLVQRYLTNSSELPASQELLDMIRSIFRVDKETFTNELELWYGRWRDS